MASTINSPGKKSNAGSYQLIGAGIGALAGNPGAGAQAGGMLGGMTDKPPVEAVQSAKSAPPPQPDQGPDPAMQRRLQELEQARLAAMNQKLYG